VRARDVGPARVRVRLRAIVDPPRSTADTETVPSILRSRLALLGLLGIFLIPVGLSSLDGLTHVTTCREGTSAPFTLAVPERGDPMVTSAATLTPDAANGLCGGLVLDMAVGADRPGRVRVTLPITNNTRYAWRGSVKLAVRGTSVPVSIGEIEPGQTKADSVSVKIGTGTHTVRGTLLIGP
jgi:hypothetical protein